MNNNLIQDVRTLIARALGVSRAHVKPETELQEQLGADSLDKVELAMRLEEEFDVDIPDSKAIAINTVNDAASLVKDVQT